LTNITYERANLGEVKMTTYTFYINGEYKTVEADTEEDAIREAGIEEGDAYDLVETDSFDDKCLLSAITDEILFGS
jgi:hypothetical protein